MDKHEIIDRLLVEGAITEDEAVILRDQFQKTYFVSYVSAFSEIDDCPLHRTREGAEHDLATKFEGREAWVDETWVHPSRYATCPE